MDNLDYLFAAFTFVWVVIFGYILFLAQKQKKLQHEIEELESLIERKN